jgi:hypothetical protein
MLERVTYFNLTFTSLQGFVPTNKPKTTNINGKNPNAFPLVVGVSAVTPRKPQKSEVVKPHSEIMSRAKEFYFSRPQNTLTALTSELINSWHV